MAVISHGLILALLPHGWIHHSPTDSSMDFDKSPSDFGEPILFLFVGENVAYCFSIVHQEL